MKKFIIVCCLVSLILIGVSCKKSFKSLPLILVVLPTSDNPYWQEMKTGIENGMRKLDKVAEVRIFAGGADTDAQRQIQVMQSFLNNGNVKALIIGPASGTQIVPTVVKYKEKGIPVIVVDSMLDKEELKKHNTEIDLFIGSKNEEGGMKAAERIETFAGTENRTVLLIEGSPVHETAIARQDGFKKAAPNTWNIIEKRADWDRTEANRKTRSVLESGIPDAIFAASDEMAMGVIAALRSADVPRENWPILVGFDATKEGLKAIEDGDMCATIKQKPGKIGAQAVEAAWDMIQKKPGIRGEQFIEVEIIPQEPGQCGNFR